MEPERILQGLLDIGEEMMKSGAEIKRVEESMYRMCSAYGFRRINVWVISSNIQATVEAPDGRIITQIRHIPLGGMNLDRLDYLNNLSRYVCAARPNRETLDAKLREVLNRKQQPLWITVMAGIMGGAGFGVFFDCTVSDTIIAIIASAIVVLLGVKLGKVESNPMIYNAILAFITETFIVWMVYFGAAQHVGRITTGVVMLLVSALGTTSGIRDTLHRDILSGILNITNSILGATGIAAGIVVSLMLFRGII